MKFFKSILMNLFLLYSLLNFIISPPPPALGATPSGAPVPVKSKKGPKVNPDKPANPSDSFYKKVLESISKFAEEKMKSSDLNIKKKLAGALPEGFPSDLVQEALESRNDKRKWRNVLALPTEVYRMCLFPFAKVNYAKWCISNNMGENSKTKNCLYNFCQVCCDHLVFIYQNSAEKSIVGELLQLNQEQGLKGIKDTIDASQSHKCKAQCKVEYPVDMPTPLPKTPRDPNLGLEKRPADSCADIKKWGPKSAKSGQYWIQLPSKGPEKVFCDMESDNGGWTLFFNYVHQPGQDLFLNENKLPADLKANSHMYLDNAGFEARDVKEIRFICTERFKDEKKYWHFKSNNRDIIGVAMKGDQSLLTAKSLYSGYSELKPPSPLVGKYTKIVDSKNIGSFDFVGNNPQGGFTSTTFGSSALQTYWTVKGDLANQDVYECGSSHRVTEYEVASEDNPTMVFTHHSIWFRGNPPSSDEARTRFMKNAQSDKK